MRTTVRLDPNLLTLAKQFALDTKRTLTSVIEDALRQLLTKRHARAHHTKIQLETVRGRGVRPGIDLDNTASLLDFMERGA